ASIALIWRNREALPARAAETTAPPIPTAKRVAPAHGKPEWTAIVDDALRSGRIAAPAVVAELQSHAATLRGETDTAHVLLAPAAHLLLGVLAARAGLEAEAARELTAYVREHPNDAAAVRLLGSFKSRRR